MSSSKEATLSLVSILTLCWYYTSSKNAIAIQHLVEGYTTNDHNDKPDNILFVSVLTSLQILFGLCISFPLYLLSKAKVRHLSTTKIDEQLKRDDSFIIVGSFHFLGCFFTNMGLFYGSATLVQVIKLLEPIQTFFFLALTNTLYFHRPIGIRTSTAIGIMLVVLGTLLVLSQNGINASMNLSSCTYTFMSGIAMTSRHVMHNSTKNTQHAVKYSKNEYWPVIAQNGFKSFTEITSIAAIPAFIILVVIEWRQNSVTNICAFIWNATGGPHALIFHGFYNFTSILVLSLISAQSYSLLVVGKGITNVIAAASVFGVELNFSGFIGLLITGTGGIIYSEFPHISTYLNCQKYLGIKKKRRSLIKKLLWMIPFLYCIYYYINISPVLQTIDNHTTHTAPLSSIDTIDTVKSSDGPLSSVSILETAISSVEPLNSASTVDTIISHRTIDTPTSHTEPLSPMSTIETVKSSVEPLKSGSTIDTVISSVEPLNSVSTIDTVVTSIEPLSSKRCYVTFQDDKMHLCNYVAWGSNFEDEIGPAISKKLLEKHFNCNADNVRSIDLNDHEKRGEKRDQCLFTLGSILQHMKSGDHVWGTGMGLFYKTEFVPGTYHAVRGNLTLQQLTENNMTNVQLPTGDPASLIAHLYPDLKWRSDGIRCFIPHYFDIKRADILVSYNGVKKDKLRIISVQGGWREVSDKIASCKSVASSSLHGLVIADALGIPNRWFQFSDGRTKNREGSFKYQDYFSTINRIDPVPIVLTVWKPGRVLNGSLYWPPASSDVQNAVVKRMTDAFPYSLFKVDYEKDLRHIDIVKS